MPKEENPAVGEGLFRRFLASSSKSAAIGTFSHTLSSPVRRPHAVFPMYRMLTKAPWFKWDSKSLAKVVAFFESQGLRLESEALISNFFMNLNQLDVGILYCELIESYSENKLQERVVESFYKLKQIPEIPRTVKLRRYKSMILGLCELGQPTEAEEMVNEMEHEGLKPSCFELVMECWVCFLKCMK